MSEPAFVLPSTLPGLLLLLTALVVLWVAVSVPVYVSGKLIAGGGAGLGSAMGATLGGTLVYSIVFYGGSVFITPVLGPLGLAAAFVLAILAWLAVYRSSFETSWAGAVAIVVLGWFVLVAIDAVLVSVFGVSLQSFSPL